MTQPLALQTADWLDKLDVRAPDKIQNCISASAELRRLHAVERRYEYIKTMARTMSLRIDGRHAWTMMLRDVNGPNLDEAIDASIAKEREQQ